MSGIGDAGTAVLTALDHVLKGEIVKLDDAGPNDEASVAVAAIDDVAVAFDGQRVSGRDRQERERRAQVQVRGDIDDVVDGQTRDRIAVDGLDGGGELGRRRDVVDRLDRQRAGAGVGDGLLAVELALQQHIAGPRHVDGRGRDVVEHGNAAGAGDIEDAGSDALRQHDNAGRVDVEGALRAGDELIDRECLSGVGRQADRTAVVEEIIADALARRTAGAPWTAAAGAARCTIVGEGPVGDIQCTAGGDEDRAAEARAAATTAAAASATAPP